MTKKSVLESNLMKMWRRSLLTCVAVLLSYQPVVYAADIVAVPFSSITASSDDGNKPASVNDGDLATRWSALGVGEYLHVTFDEEYILKELTIDFFRSDERFSQFDLYGVSSDNQLEALKLGETSVQGERYVTTINNELPLSGLRFVGKGNSNNDWNSILELSVSGVKDQTQKPKTALENLLVDDNYLLDETSITKLGNKWSHYNGSEDQVEFTFYYMRENNATDSNFVVYVAGNELADGSYNGAAGIRCRDGDFQVNDNGHFVDLGMSCTNESAYKITFSIHRALLSFDVEITGTHDHIAKLNNGFRNKGDTDVTVVNAISLDGKGNDFFSFPAPLNTSQPDDPDNQGGDGSAECTEGEVLDMRIRYQNAVVLPSESCVSEDQIQICENGKASEFSGTFTHVNCAVEIIDPTVPSEKTRTVKKGNITWHFDRDVEHGTFANGDTWIVGPAKVVNISPKSIVKDGKTLHGSMLNPSLGSKHGFDSRIKSNKFVTELNVARAFPFDVKANDVLFSAQSFLEDQPRDNPDLKQIQILTVLDKAVPSGSFRPSYFNPEKKVNYHKSSLDYAKLKKLAFPNSGLNVPDIDAVADYFQHPSIIKTHGWTNRYFRPNDNHPWRNAKIAGTYGREVAHLRGDALLLLNLNFTDEQKEELLVKMVQIGIDIYGAAKYQNAVFYADGGHNQGNKMPLLLAGYVLNDQAILDYADASKHRIFQEDQQTFYVSQKEVDITNGPNWKPDRRVSVLPYTSSDIGLPEWGVRHSSEPEKDNAHWNAIYRGVTGPATTSHILAAHIMEVTELWNWSAAFDYYDRFYHIKKPTTSVIPYTEQGVNAIQLLTRDMWDEYR